MRTTRSRVPPSLPAAPVPGNLPGCWPWCLCCSACSPQPLPPTKRRTSSKAGCGLPRITGTATHNGIRLERIIFESQPGIRAGDIARTAAWLRQLDSVDLENIGLVAIGDTTAAGLHAAAFDPGLSPVVLTSPLTSWTALVSHKRYRTRHIPHAVPAALEAYDLPDLAATLAPRPLTLINPVDHSGEPARRDLIEADYALTRTVYALAGAEEALHIKNVPPETLADTAAAALNPARPGKVTSEKKM
jgi:hypothetical protein